MENGNSFFRNKLVVRLARGHNKWKKAAKTTQQQQQQQQQLTHFRISLYLQLHLNQIYWAIQIVVVTTASLPLQNISEIINSTEEIWFGRQRWISFPVSSYRRSVWCWIDHLSYFADRNIRRRCRSDKQ